MQFFSIPMIAKLFDVHHTKQIHFFRAWLQKKGLPDKKVLIHLPNSSQLCTGSGSPADPAAPVSFIVCTPHMRSDAFRNAGEDDPRAWQPLFQTPTLEIWECVAGYTPETLPIRCGLSVEEKRMLLHFARAVISETLGVVCEAPHVPTSARFLELYNVDVAVWVNGVLRASCIFEQMPLRDGLAHAARAAVHDPRFKPLSADELPHALIEITLWDNLYIPPYAQEIARDTLYAHTGYVCRLNGRTGWYLPEVHNCRMFTGLHACVDSLAKEKAGVQTDHSTVLTSLFLFTVQDFIESPAHTPLALDGPIVQKENRALLPTTVLLHELGEASVLFLARIQESDGNIPPRIHPFSGKSEQIDWVRLALTTWALALYGNAVRDSASTRVAERAHTFLTTHLFAENSIQHHTRSLALIYTDLAAPFLSCAYDAQKFTTMIEQITNTIPLEPIHKAQYALFLLAHKELVTHAVPTATRLTQELMHTFTGARTKNAPISTAAYPELLRLLQLLNTLAPGAFRENLFNDVCTWYHTMQLPSGAFRENAHTGDRPYVRGTGKIFEVLTDTPTYTETHYTPTLHWLYTMQYSQDNTYFIEPETRARIMGGFRHDVRNPSVWIDANAHVLIGIARLRKRIMH